MKLPSVVTGKTSSISKSPDGRFGWEGTFYDEHETYEGAEYSASERQVTDFIAKVTARIDDKVAETEDREAAYVAVMLAVACRLIGSEQEFVGRAARSRDSFKRLSWRKKKHEAKATSLPDLSAMAVVVDHVGDLFEQKCKTMESDREWLTSCMIAACLRGACASESLVGEDFESYARTVARTYLLK